ncbi:MAG TPA: M1 family metallopeptidase [Nitrosopumilaceae archaeon]|nr:M1 family metallopeptidase [Nitrosopumilaceae archaeon]
MKQISPKNYQITFEPNFKNFTFLGKEKISIELLKPTNTLVLNSAKIDIKECLMTSKGKAFKTTITLDEKNEQLTIRIPEKIRGKAELYINFVGILNDKLVGLYRSEYLDKNGKKKIMATTQFEAADARRAFPCWDEPEAKATFDISVIVEKNMTAISNMPVISKKKIGNKTLFKFDRTPIMSTYLLYIGVGEFEFLTGKLGKTLIRIITTKGKKELGKLSLEFTKQFLGWYEKYFKIPYPLPKLDMIAVPDFASGAMENWGAITFRETILLYDPKTSSTETKQHIAEVISHEIAHQWFGNLVTMKWWNDLWLNESFATFMATKAVHHFYPEWDLWNQFLKAETSGAMSLDALKTSHPIDVKVNKPSEVREIFDEISYNKGGSVLRMLEDFLGEENFRKGLKNYLSKHKYGNATTEDLWNALEAVSRKPVRMMMNSWVRQVGYPVIDASLDGSKLLLSQKRYLAENDGKSQKGTWVIPVSVKTQDRLVSKLMTKKSDTLSLGDPEWIKINHEQKGLYRVKYDDDMLQKLQRLVEEKALDNADRWGIQHDLFSLCISGQMSLKNFLDFTRSYFDEDDYLVSADLAGGLDFLYLITSGEIFWDEIKEYNKEFFRKLYEKLSWDPQPGEKHTTALLRSIVIGSLGRLDDEEVIEEANKRFQEFLKKPNSLRPDLRGTVYSLVAWSGDEKTYDLLLKLYKKAQMQEEKLRFLGALCSFQDEKLLAKALRFALSRDVRSQHLHLPVMRVAGNPYGRSLVWPWVKKNWKTIVKKFGVGSPLLNRVIGSTSAVYDGKKESEIRQFFKKHPTPGTEMKLAQTLERIRIHSKFLNGARKEFLIN